MVLKIRWWAFGLVTAQIQDPLCTAMNFCRDGCVGWWYEEMVWVVVHILGVDLAYTG